ncbi:MAG TPA: sugar phosphate isomerase/epimerase family protein, partial [Tepidisphaeraceae bacterium]|nr:sugar phosphate isomerase/epimerase family protein [Tepidisphaeraceae bacterium]
MNIGGHDIGVCSWSLQPRNIADLLAKMQQLDLGRVQLAMAPLLELDEDRRRAEMELLQQSGVTITAGMINFPGEDYSSIAVIHDTGGFVPEKTWPQRKQMTLEAARLARQLGVSLLSVHIGFVPPSSHAQYEMVIGRIREMAAALAELGVELLMETGQERAAELLKFINDLAARNVHVNFDPANMLMYGAGDPIEAIEVLGRHIRHVHVKDAVLSKQPGVIWGEEVPFGTGQVGAARFLAALKKVGYTGPLAIEREAGTTRLQDVRTA